MKDFKSYSQEQNVRPAASGGSAGTEDNSKMEESVNMATMLCKAFEGKNEAQVLQTIIAQAEQGKRDGTLTNADLDNFYNTLAPLLDGFKRQRLRSIIARLKSI